MNDIEDIQTALQELDDRNWANAPTITTIDGFKWILGPKAPEDLDWYDGVAWCKSVGGELPPREVLLMCYLNEDIKKEFTETNYWSSTEFSETGAWLQYFNIGDQYFTYKTETDYVRAVRRLAI